MKISKTLLPAVAVAALFSGCQDEDFGYEARDIKYQKEFKAAFGDIDPNQTWNLATRASVTVSTMSDSNIKIYANRNGRYILVGDYANVSGTQTLGVDVVAGTQELLVTNGSQSQLTTVGGAVTFGAMTRAIIPGTYDPDEDPENPDGNEVIISRGEEKTKIFTREEAMKWNEFLPEIAYPSISNGLLQMERDKKCNLNKAANNFMMVSSGTFYVYPLFFITNQTNTVGIYIEAEDGSIKKAPLYQIKSGDELQVGLYTWVYYDRNPELPENARGLEETEDFKPAVWKDWGDDNWTMEDPAQHRELQWNNVTGATGFYDGGSADKVIAFDKLKSIPVKVEMPAGVVFGFYVDVTANQSYYSQSNRNADYDYELKYDNDGNVDAAATLAASQAAQNAGTARKACHLATFQYDGRTYLGLEDWDNQYFNSDMDFNDVMFVIEGAVPNVVEDNPELHSWILACEDLGGTFDNDFNDIVFKVEHVSGRETAIVTPLAAGGTLDSHLFYGDNDLGEIHTLLGDDSKDEHGWYTPLNVTSGRGNAGAQITIEVSTDFSMAMDDAIKGNSMGSFSVHTIFEDGTQGTSVVAAPELGQVPAMLCIPATYDVKDAASRTIKTYEWGWSLELKSLIPWTDRTGTAQEGSFPEFAGWVADHTANTDWYMHPNGSNSVPARFISEREMPEDTSTPEGSVELKKYVGDATDDAHSMPGSIFTNGTTNGAILTIWCSADIDKFYGANTNWQAAATTNNVKLNKGKNDLELTAAECATFASTGFCLNFNGGSAKVINCYITYK